MNKIAHDTRLSQAMPERKRKKQLIWPRAYHVPAVTGAHSKNALEEKSVTATSAKSVWQGAGSRPPVDATGTGVRAGPRGRTPSASRRLAALSFSPHSSPSTCPPSTEQRRTPPMGGRDFPPSAVRGRNMAVSLQTFTYQLGSSSSPSL